MLPALSVSYSSLYSFTPFQTQTHTYIPVWGDYLLYKNKTIWIFSACSISHTTLPWADSSTSSWRALTWLFKCLPKISQYDYEPSFMQPSHYGRTFTYFFPVFATKNYSAEKAFLRTPPGAFVSIGQSPIVCKCWVQGNKHFFILIERTKTAFWKGRTSSYPS